MKRPWTACSIISIIFGTIGILLCVAMLAGGYEGLFNFFLHAKMQVVQGTEVEDIWENIPVPLEMKVYLFNITNPDEFTEGAVPKLQEIGPYVYREYHHKENITFEQNMTVTFLQRKTWVWDEVASGNNSLDDYLYVLNPIPVTAASTVGDDAFLLQMLNTMLNVKDEKVMRYVTASQVIFDGFEDPILDWMQSFSEIGQDSPALFPPGLINYDRFAWFYNRNESLTYEGIFNMYTGESSLDDVGQIAWWNYSNETHFFSGSCNSVTGSAGELWPPSTIDRTFIQFYNSDLCMSPKLFYQQDIEDSFGISGFRFSGKNETFAEDCFCSEDNCIDGLLDVHKCRMGAPAFISYPHFLDADPVLLEAVEGLNPEPEKHEFYLDINPDLGIALRVAARMQINLKTKSYPGSNRPPHFGRVDILASLPDMVLPVLWFEVYTELTDELYKEIKPALFLTSSAMTIIFICLLIAFLSGVGYCIGSNVRRKKTNERLIVN